ncbi:MAG: YdcF family protein [Candidatus Pacebacteria bacterium]|nr:YdcF family protein [Candidatus Paceibacterota bacterium]
MIRRIEMIFGIVILIIGIAVVVWFILLQGFLARIPQSSQKNLKKSDVIIVLTGSAGRIDRGIELFNLGLADRLFISGVSRDADISAELARIPAKRRNCCVRLGYSAPDTRGNAQESARFMADNRLNSMILVTADFHVPRSLLEFKLALPKTVIIAEPVITYRIENKQWWLHRGSLFLILREFHKYSRARLRVLF